MSLKSDNDEDEDDDDNNHNVYNVYNDNDEDNDDDDDDDDDDNDDNDVNEHNVQDFINDVFLNAPPPAAKANAETTMYDTMELPGITFDQTDPILLVVN
jgi:hypothetical protein